jgi:DNA-binding PadR family transcriptional regulator
MHPYRMQQLIKQRAKDRIANVAQPNSVYQTIEALRRAGLVAVSETTRDERRPERTVYEITDTGRDTLQRWLHTMLAEPAREFPDFPAALSLLPLLEPETVRAYLEARASALAPRLAQLGQDMPPQPLPRLFLIEDEYQIVLLQAELSWLRSVIDDLSAGRLNWSQEQLRAWAQELTP